MKTSSYAVQSSGFSSHSPSQDIIERQIIIAIKFVVDPSRCSSLCACSSCIETFRENDQSREQVRRKSGTFPTHLWRILQARYILHAVDSFFPWNNGFFTWWSLWSEIEVMLNYQIEKWMSHLMRGILHWNFWCSVRSSLETQLILTALNESIPNAKRRAIVLSSIFLFNLDMED